ncbi:MAG: ATP phosphoribosyltransferase [Candidatus Marinamargulisbacteria bacterium]
MTPPLTIACAKGYLWKKALGFLTDMGIVFDNDLSESRQLSTIDTTGRFQLMKVRPWDVPVYIEEGAADLGVVGKDVLLEQSPDVLDLLDLKFGDCRLVIAGPESYRDQYLTHHVRVATKYEQATMDYFEKKAIRCIPIKLYGAMELAPMTGVADIISDLTATGQTLKENGLVEYDEVFYSTARLVANRASMMTKYAHIQALHDGFLSQLPND